MANFAQAYILTMSERRFSKMDLDKINLNETGCKMFRAVIAFQIGSSCSSRLLPSAEFLTYQLNEVHAICIFARYGYFDLLMKRL